MQQERTRQSQVEFIEKSGNSGCMGKRSKLLRSQRHPDWYDTAVQTIVMPPLESRKVSKMGVDLRMFPYYGPSDHVNFSHDILDVQRRRDLWSTIAEIEKQHGRDVSENFTTFCGKSDSYNDTCYGVTKETPYGTPVKYVLAVHLKPLASHPAVIDNYKNRAVWAFIGECPDDLKIALYWH